MTRFSYRERDYVFGERMLTLRSAIGLTQAGLAELLGVSRRAVSRWETSESYPNLASLTALLTLVVRASAWPGVPTENFWPAEPSCLGYRCGR